jgi:hypothetical protein
MKGGLALPVYGALALLLLILAVEWLPQGDPAIALPVAPRMTHGATPEADTTARDTAAWATTILRRPLFTTGRRPQKSAGHLAQTAATGLPRLSGIMITAGGKRAIFMPDSGKAMTLAEGAALDDYTIRRIAADRVVLHGAKGDMVLHPTYDPSHSGGVGIAVQNFGQPMNTPAFPPGPFNPGMAPVGMPPMGFPQPQPAPPPPNSGPNGGDDDNSDAPAQPVPSPVLPQFPGIRGPFIPRGRN